MRHATDRIRYASRQRTLQVAHKEMVTPRMLRIIFAGDLDDFRSAGADDHVKIYVPGRRGALEGRDFTPRSFDPDRRLLTLDFAVHSGGPAIEWATSAQVGDRIDITGPRGSLIVPQTFDWWLLVGDETALPAMGRRVSELPPSARVITIGIVEDPAEEQEFASLAAHRPFCVHRPAAAATDPRPLMVMLEALKLPPGDGYVWIAAESRVARAARQHFLVDRRHPAQWMRASGYWVRGQADAYDRL